MEGLSGVDFDLSTPIETIFAEFRKIVPATNRVAMPQMAWRLWELALNRHRTGINELNRHSWRIGAKALTPKKLALMMPDTRMG
jgi:hypothetical protein